MRLASAIALAGLAMATPCRDVLERTMAGHMLVQYPVLLAAGWCGARALPWRALRRLRPWNPAGAPGLLAALALLTATMVPRVIDLAVADPAVDVIKAAMLVAAGGLASVAWRPAGRLGQAFAVGNAAWMLAAGGLVLAESPARVCASYLEGDQARAGFGLVAWAIAGSVAWLASLRRRPRKGVRARLTAARDRAPLSPRASRP